MKSRYDLTTCDNCLWAHIKEIVSKQRYHFKDELKAAVPTAFRTISLLCWEKCRTGHGVAQYYAERMRDEFGQHTDTLDTYMDGRAFGPPFMLSPAHRHIQGRPGGHGPLKFLTYRVSLCFEKRRPKQKYCCSPDVKHFGPSQNFSWQRHWPCGRTYDWRYAKAATARHSLFSTALSLTDCELDLDIRRCKRYSQAGRDPGSLKQKKKLLRKNSKKAIGTYLKQCLTWRSCVHVFNSL